MSSNMLAGERRWNARRGGMTVLGKVTVPKPMKLPSQWWNSKRGGMTVLGKVTVPKPLKSPSQRLENHGLDPGAEIVPKGTPGLGSNPSSSGSSVWVSTSVSPNGDGGNTSPIHSSGHPSSVGSGIRSSAAGSDGTHEPIASAWGSNSRPSSDTGTFAPNQSSLTSLRPRSAETRPNSLQLSRFADPVSGSPVAWSPSTAAEKLGVKSSKVDGFTQSSGDFATRGSGKDNTAKNLESQDHSRLGSAPERITSSRDGLKHQVGLGADPKSAAVNSWRNDGSRVEEDGFHPGTDKRWNSKGGGMTVLGKVTVPKPVNLPSQRWNARRGGMTFLGKVTVPKPLNLPSQRLEKHGLDPSAEQMPKGTPGWGSNPSSSGSNAWLSSSVLPNADGGNTSPNHLSLRPSSGGGTRPSTAGSNRIDEPVASAWGSNSRPSSASGTLASNQPSLTSLRPRSAETRPNSLLPSRHAEPVFESPVAWRPSNAAESSGIKSSRGDGFSLSCGDFATLGSVKVNTVKNVKSQDYSRPSLVSERVTPSREDAKHQVGLGSDSNCGPVNLWRNEGSRVEEDGFHLGMEKRWNARRGGLTVLGKVTVPKPLNLPSQRLENHGLDRGVELAPKPTLGWGSRPSSSGSNAWISSSVSLNDDGGNTSPNHLSESGTRPSTSGSDRTPEPISSALGAHTIASPTSATLASNQSPLTSLRPRSAETRPNSSQLSRFADPGSESSVAWGPVCAAEGLGANCLKEDGFSLSSGDFSFLGPEKDNTVKNLESQDPSHLISASERTTPSREDAKHQVVLGAETNCGPVNSWRNDGSRVEEHGVHPGMEKVHGEPQKYFNANINPQHFDTWRGPVNVPDIWYGGPPRGPAFGPPGPSGSYSMEPFPYYHRPQIPPSAMASSQAIPPPANGPRGPHPNNGELYRPHMPDSYARPGMPYRPDYFPGPHSRMAFEGYFGPMGYCNNEREISYMGMPAAPPVYNCFPSPIGPPDNVSSHGRAGGHATTGKALHERMRADPLEDTGGPKQHSENNSNDQDQRDETEDWEHRFQPDASQPGKGFLPVPTSRNYEWRTDDDAERDLSPKNKTPTENSSQSLSYRDQYSDCVQGKSLGGIQNVSVNDGWTNKSVGRATFSPHVSQLSTASELPLPPGTIDPTMMHRIEGVNTDTRSSDGWNEADNAYHIEEQRNRSAIMNQKPYISTGIVVDNAGDFVPISKGVFGLDGEKQVQSMFAVPRRQYHGGQGRVDHRSKGKFNDHDTDGWRRKPRTPEIISAATSSNMETVTGPYFVGEGAEFSSVSSVLRVEGKSVTETFDSTDIQAQRVKWREVAKQRALQIQKEEEERLREQRARALAKLEELNKRTQICESAPVTCDIQGETEKSRVAGTAGLLHPQSQPPSTNLISESGSDVLDREKTNNNEGISVYAAPHASQTGVLESLESHVHTLPIKENTLNGEGTSVHKSIVNKLKQSSDLQNSSSERSVPNIAPEAHINGAGLIALDNTSAVTGSSELKQSFESNVHAASDSVTGSSTPQRKNKNNINEQRVDEEAAPPLAISDLITESKSMKESKVTSSILDSPVSSFIEPDGVQALEASSALPTEQPQSRFNNNWKPQPLRRMPRSQHANRFTEKVHGSDVVWAPVRPQNKTGDSVDTGQKSMESENFTKNDNLAQNSYEDKRAEMGGSVPKPVVKELAQQGSAPLVSSSVSSPFRLDEIHWTIQFGSISTEISQPLRLDDIHWTIQFGSINFESARHASSTSAFAVSNFEVQEGDVRHCKPTNEHGHWEKRAKEPAPMSESVKDTQQSLEQNQSVKVDKNLANADFNIANNVDTGGWSNTSNNPSTAAANRTTSVKSQGTTGRGKRPNPNSRKDGINTDHEFSVETNKSSLQLAVPIVKDNCQTLDTREQRGMGERSSHWKAKSFPHSASNKQVNKSSGSQTVTETNKSSRKDYSSQRKVVALPQQDQPFSDYNVTQEPITGHHQEFNREKKHIPAKDRSSFWNEDPVVSADSAPGTSAGNQRHHNMSGPRRTANQHNRYARPGDWNSKYDNRPHNVPVYREKQRHNVQYEYQPVGPSKGGNLEKHDWPADRANERRPKRNWEKGQVKRGGNYYRREGGSVRVEPGQE